MKFEYIGNQDIGSLIGSVPTTPISAPTYNVTIADAGYMLLGNATTGNLTVNLPSVTVVPVGFAIYVKKIDASVNEIFIEASGSELINGHLSVNVSAQNDGIGITSNGTAWYSFVTNADGAGVTSVGDLGQNISDFAALSPTVNTFVAFSATHVIKQTASQAKTSLAITNSDVSGLGTAATLNVGTGANQIVQLTGAIKLPAVDASLLTGITSTQISGLGTAATLNVGTGANQIVQLNSTGRIPAINGSLLTGLTSSQISGLGTAATLNVGTGANQIVQLDSSARLPAVNASLLTNVPGKLIGVQAFTSNGTYTRSAGASNVIVHVAGGGGGGGASATFTGSSGGTSSFGAYCSATGGGGGQTGGTDYRPSTYGPTPGIGSGANLNLLGGGGTGGNGGIDYQGSGTDNTGARGADGGLAIEFITGVTATVVVTIGAGGAGGADSGGICGGEAGQHGYVVIYEYSA